MEEFRKLWTPSQEIIAKSHLAHYVEWLATHRELHFSDYESLWQWSIDDIESFWASLFDFFPIVYEGNINPVLSGTSMPGYRWFEGVKLNIAENLCAGKSAEELAVISIPESNGGSRLTWGQLMYRAAHIQDYLYQLGLKKGDTVCGILTNSADTSAAFLAVAASGMIWTCSSPDFGVGSIIDRFEQVQPRVMLAVSEYAYGGKHYTIIEKAKSVAMQIESIASILMIDNMTFQHMQSHRDPAISAFEGAPLKYERMGFNDPLWILYSSGTTGKPKAITHSQGGILLELYKYHAFHNDTQTGEIYFWFSTTGWMMWNFMHGAWLFNATLLLYDGSPGYNRVDKLWQLAEQHRINHFGTSAPYILSNLKAGIDIREKYDLSALRSIGSTGSPLPTEGFDYVYEQIKTDVWLHSMSGGTDVCTAFVGGCLMKPVYEGVIQCRALGAAIFAWDENGKAVTNEMGEMVVTRPMPSMPIYFWNDEGGVRYKESYFDMFPGVWRHGDWITITDEGGVIIHGRSDATLNRQGIRIGTSEIYRNLMQMDAIADSLIVNLEQPDGSHFMPLFIMLNPEYEYDEALKKAITQKIRTECSPRHVPDAIYEIDDIPYTLSGKKMEAPIKKILMGQSAEQSITKDTMRNPESVAFFVDFYTKIKKQQ